MLLSVRHLLINPLDDDELLESKNYAFIPFFNKYYSKYSELQHQTWVLTPNLLTVKSSEA